MFAQNEYIDLIARGLVLSAVALSWVILLTRIVGLRSFSKMTAFDFVMTIAMGSLVAGASRTDEWQAFLQALVAMTGLFAIQFVSARIRHSSDWFEQVVENSPRLLMRDGVILEDALEATRVTREDLIAKLREANAKSFDDVRAVVLETTGDISVLHGEGFDDRLLEGVSDGQGMVIGAPAA